MMGFAQRLAWLCAPLLGVAMPSLAQDTPTRSAVTVCAEAANSYALQTEVYSDAIKLLMYESRNNPAEQAQRLAALQPRHDAFKPTALDQEQTRRQSQTWSAADVRNDTQIKTWVIDNLLAFATDKYGQDALFFKFYIVNRCKKQFAS